MPKANDEDDSQPKAQIPAGPVFTEAQVRQIVRDELSRVRAAELQVNAGRGPARW